MEQNLLQAPEESAAMPCVSTGPPALASPGAVAIASGLTCGQAVRDASLQELPEIQARSQLHMPELTQFRMQA